MSKEKFDSTVSGIKPLVMFCCAIHVRLFSFAQSAGSWRSWHHCTRIKDFENRGSNQETVNKLSPFRVKEFQELSACCRWGLIRKHVFTCLIQTKNSGLCLRRRVGRLLPYITLF